MRWIILLAAAAIAIPFVISFVAPAGRVGAAVSARFLERPGGIPQEPTVKPAEINASTLFEWVTARETAPFARAYAWRVIPIDFAYIIAFGGFLALAAYFLATTAIAPGNLLGRAPITVWLICPALYALTDLLEDILIMTLLTRPEVIGDVSISALAVLRSVKIVTSALALLQVFVLGLGGNISPGP
jgi:hypothetical protein